MATNKESSSNSVGESKRGFASMDENKQREIASQGGKAAHKNGTAHEFDSEEARRAGEKGGKAAHEKGTAHEFSSEEAREAGRKGGESRGKGGSDEKGSSFSPGVEHPSTLRQVVKATKTASNPGGKGIRPFHNRSDTM